MKLKTKKSFNNWVRVDEDSEDSIEFLLDYTNREQTLRLQSIGFGDDYSGNDKGLKFAQYFIKFTVKDWRSTNGTGKTETYLLNEDNEKVYCKVINNELEDDIWWALVNDPITAMGIFGKIREELEFSDADKKKLSLQESSKETGSSGAKEETTQ